MLLPIVTGRAPHRRHLYLPHSLLPPPLPLPPPRPPSRKNYSCSASQRLSVLIIHNIVLGVTIKRVLQRLNYQGDPVRPSRLLQAATTSSNNKRDKKFVRGCISKLLCGVCVCEVFEGAILTIRAPCTHTFSVTFGVNISRAIARDKGRRDGVVALPW